MSEMGPASDASCRRSGRLSHGFSFQFVVWITELRDAQI